MKRFVLLCLSCLLGLPAAAQAAMTNWTEVQGGAVRLIASGPIEDGRYMAGLEFLLEPGWHTYWRYPGEAGIPPQITLTGTDNLKAFEILYPAPERYSDGFSESIVYHDGIVLPVVITPETPGEQVRLSMEIFFGICNEICVPGDAVLSLDFSPDAKPDGLAAKLIARDLAAVPKSSSDGELKVTSVGLSGDGGHLVVDAQVANGEAPDLFAAGPEGSFIGLPKLAEHSGSKATWHLSTKGLSQSKDDNTLRLVLTAGGRSIEHLEAVKPDWIQ